MKNLLYVLLLLLPILVACEDVSFEKKEYPLVKTLAPTIDENGVTLRGELIQTGSKTNTTFGFYLSANIYTISQGQGEKIIVGKDIKPGSFELMIDSGLPKGRKYYYRAFAITDSLTVYGTMESFTSKGSRYYPWELVFSGSNLVGNGYPYGSSDNQFGYITFPTSDSYIFNPEKKEVIKTFGYPTSCKQLSWFASANVNGQQYFINNSNGILYRRDADHWSKITTKEDMNYYVDFYFHTFATFDSLFIFSNPASMYNFRTNTWEKKALYTEYLNIGGVNLNRRAFIIAKNSSIGEYDIQSDSWKTITKFPGPLQDRIVSFAYDNKLYFGLSYSYNLMYKGFFSYDLSTKTWKRLVDMPEYMDVGVCFNFSIKNKLYVGYSNNGNYRIWLFDPTKVK